MGGGGKGGVAREDRDKYSEIGRHRAPTNGEEKPEQADATLHPRIMCLRSNP